MFVVIAFRGPDRDDRDRDRHRLRVQDAARPAGCRRCRGARRRAAAPGQHRCDGDRDAVRRLGVRRQQDHAGDRHRVDHDQRASPRSPAATRSTRSRSARPRSVPTFFAKIFGFNSFNVHVKATACSPCGSKPGRRDARRRPHRLDVPEQRRRSRPVLHRPEQREGRESGRSSSFFDPKLAYVGLGRPPAGDERREPLRRAGDRELQLGVRGVHDRADVARLQERRRHAQQLVEPRSRRSPASRAPAAPRTRTRSRRRRPSSTRTAGPNVPDVIVFMSDGAANTGPTYYATTSPYRTQPCHQGITSVEHREGEGHDRLLDRLRDRRRHRRLQVVHRLASSRPAITIDQALGGHRLRSPPTTSTSRPRARCRASTPRSPRTSRTAPPA